MTGIGDVSGSYPELSLLEMTVHIGSGSAPAQGGAGPYFVEIT